MSTCTICGKKGLFLKVNSMGMCRACSLENEKIEEKKRQLQIELSKNYFNKIELMFYDVRRGINNPSDLSTILDRIHLCVELKTLLRNYADYPFLNDIIESKIKYKNDTDEHLGLGHIDAFSISILKTDDTQQIFNKLMNSVENIKNGWYSHIKASNTQQNCNILSESEQDIQKKEDCTHAKTIDDFTEFQNTLQSLNNHTICTSSEKHKKLNLYEMPELKFSTISVKTNYEKLGTFVVIDTETTGLSAGRDEIIEIAAILFDNWIPIKKFETLIKPKKEIPQNIKRLTGISNEMVTNSPAFYEILDSLYDFISNYNIVGHNLSFDMGFLYKNGLDTFSQKRKYFDTLDIARKTLKNMPNYKLVTLSKYYNIRDNSSAHRALSDCLATGYLFNKLAYKRINS